MKIRKVNNARTLTDLLNDVEVYIKTGMETKHRGVEIKEMFPVYRMMREDIKKTFSLERGEFHELYSLMRNSCYRGNSYKVR